MLQRAASNASDKPKSLKPKVGFVIVLLELNVSDVIVRYSLILLIYAIENLDLDFNLTLFCFEYTLFRINSDNYLSFSCGIFFNGFEIIVF